MKLKGGVSLFEREKALVNRQKQKHHHNHADTLIDIKTQSITQSLQNFIFHFLNLYVEENKF